MSTTRSLRNLSPASALIEQGARAIQAELKLTAEFPPEVETAAAHAAANPRLPELDRCEISLITIDPPGSMDLDQAMFVERAADGYRVYYAIADVAAFVMAGDAIDTEAHRRGETLYGIDSRIPLHPKVLSEGAASLLPEQVRPALLWVIDLDRSGEGVAVDVRRARVRSRARLDYASVQQSIDAGTADPMWAVLREIGELRKARETARGGVSLALPEQEIRCDDGACTLEFRARLPVEDWNEQISLLTGMAAAHLMMQGKVGILRTLPDPEGWAIERLRRTAKALDIAWPKDQGYADFIRSLDPSQPVQIAMLTASTSLLRGAGYAAFNGDPPAQSRQSALAAEYTHTTAPLRRLVDRYSGEVCLALCAGSPVPDWVLAALPALPETMQKADRRANQYERAIVDLVEAIVLSPRVGETFNATVVEIDRDDPRRGTMMLREPAIEAPVTSDGPLPLGAQVDVTLVEADPLKRITEFALATAKTPPLSETGAKIQTPSTPVA